MRRTLLLQAACMALCFAVTATDVRAQQSQTVAHVLDVKGQWRLDGSSAPVTAGQSLAAGARISAAPSRPGDAITILRDEDMSRQRIACDASDSNPCLNPVVIPAASAVTAGPSQLSGIVHAALSILLSKPPAIRSNYALTLTRGMGQVHESEAVVPLDPSQGIVLPPAPREMAAGQYSISIERAGEKSPQAVLTGQLTSEGTWRPLPWGTTGLFDVSIENADGKQVALTTLLVTPQAKYAAIQAELDAMKARTATWTGPSARSDERLFLRAFLLSESQP